MRVDGNSAFGSDFGLQTYPKASASWVISDEGFWQPGWGAVKLRAAYGQSGRAPGAFDATRTWTSQIWAGRPTLVPQNLGDPNIGPEVTAEFETGFDASWLDDRFSAALTYYNQTTSDALFGVAQIPTTGFTNPQRSNVGTINNQGTELALNLSPIREANWGWDVGLDMTTNKSEVVSLGGIPPFSTGGGWVQEGYPAPVLRGKRVTNPDAIAAPIIEDNHIYGPSEPTRTFSPRTTVRVPGGITLSAQGEYRGGHYVNDGGLQTGVTRGAWMPFCWAYYVSPYDGPTERFAPPNPAVHTLTLKPDTPALERALCTSTISTTDITTTKGDFFRLRNLGVQIPVDFVFPDRVSNAQLTLSLNNAFGWQKASWMIRDPDMGSSEGLVDGPGVTSLPTPITGNISLRLQF
jgi:hypothetical protein